ncbi:hypothetical protein ACSNOH_35400, partial [Streptomyces sp. URMC 127]
MAYVHDLPTMGAPQPAARKRRRAVVAFGVAGVVAAVVGGAVVFGAGQGKDGGGEAPAAAKP